VEVDVVAGLQAVPQVPLLLPLCVATTTATTANAAAPPISRRLGLRWAWCTPAGLPGAKAETSAAMACEPIIAAADRATNAVLNFVIAFPLKTGLV